MHAVAGGGARRIGATSLGHEVVAPPRRGERAVDFQLHELPPRPPCPPRLDQRPTCAQVRVPLWLRFLPRNSFFVPFTTLILNSRSLENHFHTIHT